jgi:hypothetical protein
MTWKDMQQLATTSFPCPYCGVDAGQRCVTKSGARANWTHTSRSWPIHTAWATGYEEGVADVLDSAIDSPEWFDRRVNRHRQSRATEAMS